ncbi:MAG: GntR family transcriptional regulator [Verrucomicrobiae bacterium]|nr:GntR family transcriptional regulator [Verrucomicrobiae bacterium]
MNFLRTRAEQLASFLRDSLRRGELKEPLPGIREWSARLGVGHVTLQQALRILEADRLLIVQSRRGVRLAAAPRAKPSAPRVKRVRWLYVGRRIQGRSIWMEVFAAISERLREFDIHFTDERCDARRLRAIQAAGEQPNEMLLLTDFREKEQRLFASFRRSALLIQLPAPGITLPYIWNDAEGALRHGIRELVGRGFTHLCLVSGRHADVTPTERLFLRVCAESAPPVLGELARLPFRLDPQQAAARRFAAHIHGRLGVLALFPISATMLISALLERGVKVPEQVEVVVINAMWHSVRVVPPPMFYPFPVEAFARVVVRAALEYFQRGAVPRLKKLIPLEVVRPRGASKN